MQQRKKYKVTFYKDNKNKNGFSGYQNFAIIQYKDLIF